MASKFYGRLRRAGIIVIAILLIGTIGYWLIGGGQYSFIDALYMAVITITTIGFEEVIDLTGNVAGTIFTMFIAISGVGVMAYIVTNIIALVVERELTGRSVAKEAVLRQIKLLPKASLLLHNSGYHGALFQPP